ncbi:hypothetical protein JTB14_033751 [Gonioctena quinquepunctata]|nr:hypothetical protein JTB14_033751 [Gonioctena quinquepunctata]
MGLEKLKLIVFDLDYTLWPFWVDTHVSPPFKKGSNGTITDSAGTRITCYPHVPEVLKNLYEEGYTMAIASRTTELKGACQLIQLFGWEKYFRHKEIFPGGKVTHFNNIKSQSGVEFDDMIFFDDEQRNIRDISELGVVSILVKDGVSKAEIEEGKKRLTATFDISYDLLKYSLFHRLHSKIYPFPTISMDDKNIELVLQGNSEFTKNHYKVLAQDEGNVFFSPISIHAILSVVSQGAAGNTKNDLANTLNVPDVKVAAEGYKDIMSRLNSVLRPSHFLCDIQSLDFDKNIEAAKTINSWVLNKTKDKIKDLIDSKDLDKSTRLVLVNAIYFKGKWAEPFDAANTKTEKFYLDGTRINFVYVQMMHLNTKFHFKNDETLGAKVLELHYINKDVSMIIILPNERDGIKKLEEKLAQTDLTKITEHMYRPEVNVSLPKIMIEQTIDLKDSLTELGLGDMFTDTADFSGMLESPEALCVSKVVHKAFIEVNEEGSEAAAASAMAMKGIQCFWTAPTPEEFLVDHPFIVILGTKKTSEDRLILFYGRILQPDQHSCGSGLNVI